MAHTSSHSETSPLLDENTGPNIIEDDGGTAHPNPSTKDTRLHLRIAAAMYSFATLGLFNSSIGAVLPLLSSHYSLTNLNVSFIFLAGPIGYVVAAQCSDAIHVRYGQRGIAFFSPLLQFIATAVAATRPRFGMVFVAFALQGLGAGLLDGSWCAWAGSMKKANTVSGLLHGSYSIGGGLGPILVTSVLNIGTEWWRWYYFLTGANAIALLVLGSAFQSEDAASYRRSTQYLPTGSKVDVKDIIKYRATWFCAAYFLTYVGTEAAISGWLISFMLGDRKATLGVAGLAASGYWIGMTVGRLVLGFVADRLGVRRATALYFLFAIGIEILFAVFSSATISIVLMTMLGFVMGPMFPSGVVVLTRLLPGELHVAAVSFVASLGQVGGAFLPFAIGALIQTLDIGVFRFAILLQTTLAFLVWAAFARLRSFPLPNAAVRVED